MTAPISVDAPVFVDSNVLIYAVDSAHPAKQEAAQRWRAFLWKSGRGRVSFQVIHEFYVNALRIRPGAIAKARDEIRDLMDWKPVAMGAAVLQLGWKIQDRYRLSFWDALVVAAAKYAACRYLLTEDLQAKRDLDGVLVVNPFLTEPATLVG